jgi:hypothetical protein
LEEGKEKERSICKRSDTKITGVRKYTPNFLVFIGEKILNKGAKY